MAEAAKTPEVGDSPTPEPEAKGLRAQLEATQAELKSVKAKEKVRAFDDAGFDTEQGLGKAIFKEYDGELDKDAVLEYAKTEYNWSATAESEHPEAPQILGGTERLEAVTQTAGSITPPSEAGMLAEAEASGDYQKTLAMKAEEMGAWFSGKP